MEKAGIPGVDQHCQRKDLHHMGYNAGTVLQNAPRTQEEKILYKVHMDKMDGEGILKCH